MSNNEIISPENLVYAKPKSLKETYMHYCPGCSHGVVHRIIAEIIDEMDIQDKTIGIAPVGCAVFAYNYIDIDWQEAAHGRAPALATAIKRLLPDRYVFTYQGDGDLAAIGTAETIHACNRGENIVIIFINNGIYDDRWTNGTNHTAGYGNFYYSLWAENGIEWLSSEYHQFVGTIARNLLCYASKRSVGSRSAKSKKSHSESF